MALHRTLSDAVLVFRIIAKRECIKNNANNNNASCRSQFAEALSCIYICFHKITVLKSSFKFYSYLLHQHITCNVVPSIIVLRADSTTEDLLLLSYILENGFHMQILIKLGSYKSTLLSKQFALISGQQIVVSITSLSKRSITYANHATSTHTVR